MKVVSYTALHYGADYLGWAIRSVIDYVDEHYIFYTDVGSHGHRTDRPNPDSRDTLKAIAQQAAGDKLRWHEGRWSFEGEQREMIHRYAPDADVILVVDADEVWQRGIADVAVGYYMNCVEHYALPQYGRIRVPIIHYWRSFKRAVIHDPAYPVRIIYPKAPPVEGAMSIEDYRIWGWSNAVINHFGYAQRSEVVEYKLLTHGHRNEFRRDCNWFTDKFMANSQEDCHPVGSDHWWPEQVNPLDYMPEWMKDHPYFNMEVIP